MFALLATDAARLSRARNSAGSSRLPFSSVSRVSARIWGVCRPGFEPATLPLLCSLALCSLPMLLVDVCPEPGTPPVLRSAGSSHLSFSFRSTLLLGSLLRPVVVPSSFFFSFLPFLLSGPRSSVLSLTLDSRSRPPMPPRSFPRRHSLPRLLCRPGSWGARNCSPQKFLPHCALQRSRQAGVVVV